MPLREAICDRILKDTGVHYAPSQICVTSGAKHNVYIALQAIINAGEEVILPAPYWVTYAEAIRMAGGVPVIVETTEETGFKLTLKCSKQCDHAPYQGGHSDQPLQPDWYGL